MAFCYIDLAILSLRSGNKSLKSQYKLQLSRILSEQTEILQRLEYLRHLDKKAYLCAGVIRNAVWAHLHEQGIDIYGTEIDVIFYDEMDLENQKKQYLMQQLEHKFPENDWDVINQALVHTWYKTENNQTISPLISIEHALSLWPETATAVAVRLDDQHDIQIIAPFGLDDLFELKLRWNKQLVSHETFKKRYQAKRFFERFPKLQLID